MEKQPFGFSHMLEAVDLYERGPTEVVIVGDRNSPDLLEWVERMGCIYVPNLAIFVADPMPTRQRFHPRAGARQAANRRPGDRLVCREHTCSPPMTTFKDLQKELAG